MVEDILAIYNVLRNTLQSITTYYVVFFYLFFDKLLNNTIIKGYNNIIS